MPSDGAVDERLQGDSTRFGMLGQRVGPSYAEVGVELTVQHVGAIGEAGEQILLLASIGGASDQACVEVERWSGWRRSWLAALKKRVRSSLR